MHGQHCNNPLEEVDRDCLGNLLPVLSFDCKSGDDILLVVKALHRVHQMENVKHDCEIPGTVLMQEEKQTTTCLLPGIDISNPELIQHDSPLNRPFGIISLHTLVVHTDASFCDRVQIPVVLVLLRMLRQLQKTGHHFVLAQVGHIV